MNRDATRDRPVTLFRYPSVTPESGDHAGAHGAPALADGKAQALLHRNRARSASPPSAMLSPGITISVPCGQLHRTRSHRWCESKTAAGSHWKNGVCRPPSSLLSTYTSALELGVRGDRLPGLASTWPRSTSSRLVPRSSTPMLSPACPWSSSLRNISTPVHTVLMVGFKPTISISSPTLTIAALHAPGHHRAAPEIENTSSTGIRNGPSSARLGCGM